MTKNYFILYIGKLQNGQMTGVLHLLLLILAIISYIEYGYGLQSVHECTFVAVWTCIIPFFLFCFNLGETLLLEMMSHVLVYRGFGFVGCAFFSLIAVKRVSVLLLSF